MPAPTIPLKERKAEPVKPISRRRRLSGGTSSRSFMATLHPCRNLAGLPRGGKLLALGRVSQDEEPVLSKLSAGILLYRGSRSALEVLLVHLGGPFWRNKDEIGRASCRDGVCQSV